LALQNGNQKWQAEEFLVAGCQFFVTQNPKPKTLHHSHPAVST
jgi:hypothetical protein